MISALAFGVATASCCLMLSRQLRSWTRNSAGMLERTEADLALLFIFVSRARLILVTVLAAVTTFVLGRLLGAPWLLCGLSALSMAMAPRFIVRLLRHRWRRRITAQLPDALALWAGLLRAGQAMAPALTQLASRQPDPLGAELGLVLSQYRLGVSLDVAMGRLRDRSAVPDLRILATLLRAQRDLGGNLAEALDRLAAMLRNRLALEARIRSLTAQGRLQGVVVGVLPLLLAAVLCVMEPAAMGAMVTTPIGWAAMALVLVLEIAGFAMIRRIVNIDV
ncbi:MAG: type II secretion system F family protein [Proteobacteria bacterium]|nr:type II secretion system F family protein [Pseudomonadota bacterium]MBK7116379.1 type II secretion system F family protein [Pseudomonadota bacterium]MCC6631995.1 type II secretion system F family protein [Gammaproteobacteria bacterium]